MTIDTDGTQLYSDLQTKEEYLFVIPSLAGMTFYYLGNSVSFQLNFNYSDVVSVC